jgi:hypothetical protein
MADDKPRPALRMTFSFEGRDFTVASNPLEPLRLLLREHRKTRLGDRLWPLDLHGPWIQATPEFMWDLAIETIARAKADDDWVRPDRDLPPIYVVPPARGRCHTCQGSPKAYARMRGQECPTCHGTGLKASAKPKVITLEDLDL